MMNASRVAIYFCEYAAFVLIAITLIRYAWHYFGTIYRFATANLGLVAILSLLYLMIYGFLGSSLGIPYLFWHEDFPSRLSASVGATLLLAIIGLTSFYIDHFPYATELRELKWLDADEKFRERMSLFWKHFPFAWFPRITSLKSCFQVLEFAIGALVDPTAIVPFGHLTESSQGQQVRLQRFLRAARMPFLLLLLAPALIPGCFTEVPGIAPRTGYTTLDQSQEIRAGAAPAAAEPTPLDVRTSFKAYALGAFTWLLGIWIGVLVVKILIRFSESIWRDGTTSRPGPGVATKGGVHGSCTPGRGLTCATSGCPRAGAPHPDLPPVGCLESNIQNRSILRFFAVILVVYVVLSLIPNSLISPAFAICVLLAFLAMVWAFLKFLPGLISGYLSSSSAGISLVILRRPRLVLVPIILFGVVYLGVANNGRYKNRFENMDYDHLVQLRPKVEEVYPLDLEDDEPIEATRTQLVSDLEAREKWAKQCNVPGKPQAEKPKLVVVAVSGGASRSAYWSATVLDRLERQMPGFGRHVRLITGASGGMLGASHYVEYRREVADRTTAEPKTEGATTTDVSPWVAEIPSRSIEDLARFIALNEIGQALIPFNTKEDRGVILEKNWERLHKLKLRDLARWEREGQIPSLILSPMLVDDGRRLLISNLDLYRNHVRYDDMGFDVKVSMTWKDAGQIDREATNLVIAAVVGNVLHVRAFDNAGRRIVDTDEVGREHDFQAKLMSLKDQLEPLWLAKELTKEEKSRLAGPIASVVDYDEDDLQFGIELIPSLEDAIEIPERGRNKIIVADVQGSLHFRMFDGLGHRIIDTDEEWQEITRSKRVADFKKYLAKLKTPHQLTGAQNHRVLAEVIAVSDHRHAFKANKTYEEEESKPIETTTTRIFRSRGRLITSRQDNQREVDNSISGLEYDRLFPPQEESLLLSTAVRMSATFPFVSPAVNLPTVPPRRVVDAGYYDNYGVQVAVAWLRQNFDWLAENTSGILLVQIRDSNTNVQRLGIEDEPSSWWNAITRGYQFVTSPIDAFDKARYTTSAFRNDVDVQNLINSFTQFMRGKVADHEQFFTTVVFENSATVMNGDANDKPLWDILDEIDRGQNQDTSRYRPPSTAEVALTWYLTRAEKTATRRAIPADPSPGTWEEDRRYLAIKDLQGQVADLMKSVAEDPDQVGENREMVRYLSKILEQLRNYQRLRNVEKWWKEAGTPMR